MKKYFTLFRKEIKDLFFNKASYLFFSTTIAIIVYSFYSAIILYSQASTSAINNPLYASGFEPSVGVFVPTFGGLFILFSLFLPFVFIRSISLEKANKTLEILVQLQFRLIDIVVIKFLAGLVYLLFSLFLILPSLFLWKFLGGHIPLIEVLLLFLGYFFYGMIVLSISMFSSTVTRNISSASILALIIILIGWFIDFAKEMNISEVLIFFSHYTFTQSLKSFEDGILSLQIVLYLLFVVTIFLLFAYLWLRYDFSMRKKNQLSFVAFILFGLSLFLISTINQNKDISESHRNSFPLHITKVIQKLPSIQIDIYLRKTDSRYKDYYNSFLKKIFLLKNDIKVNLIQGKKLNDNYGLFKYTINHKSDITYSNSEEEIFPILFHLADVQFTDKKDSLQYKGYPLVVAREKVFYVVYLYILITFIFILLVFFRLRKK